MRKLFNGLGVAVLVLSTWVATALTLISPWLVD